MIKILDVTKRPIQHVGKMAGICYSSDVEDETKNYTRGIDCLEHNHGRTLEYVDVTVEIDEYSNRMIRELYTTIIGVTRLQQSTRYVDMSKRFDEYYIPPKIMKNPITLEAYEDAMWMLKDSYEFLIKQGIAKEDAGNLVPLGQHTTIVLKINLRALQNLFAVRTCTRAYIEYREFMNELRGTLMGIDKEWEELCKVYFTTKCDKVGYCDEKKSCGRFPLREDTKIVKKHDDSTMPYTTGIALLNNVKWCTCLDSHWGDNVGGRCIKCGGTIYNGATTCVTSVSDIREMTKELSKPIVEHGENTLRMKDSNTGEYI